MDDNNLDQLFKKLDDAIADNREIMLNLFLQLKSSVDELESENEEKYHLYRFQLHSKKASYLKAVGKLDEFEREDKLMNIYSAKCQKQEQEQIDDRKQQRTKDTFVLSTECDLHTDLSIEDAIVNSLNNLKATFEENEMTFFHELQSTVMDFTKTAVNSLDDFIRLNSMYSSIKTALNTLAGHVQIDLAETKDHDTTAVFTPLFGLNHHVTNLQYQRKVNFVSFVLSDRSSLRSILFANIPLTEERIQSHTKKLFVLFHPDRCQLEQKAMFTEVFQLIAEDTSKQLKELSERANHVGLVEHYETIGKECWDIAVEYSCARKQKWDKVKQSNRETLMNLTERELEYHQYHHAIRAYEQYRAAARQLEAAEASKCVVFKKVELRKYMALCLYLSGASRMLEAQIYVIAGIHLAVTSGSIALCKDALEQLEQLLRKIHRANEPSSAVLDDTLKEKDELVLSNALVAYTRGTVRLNQLENAISSELRMTILQKCSLRGEERRVAILEESTLQVRKKGVEFAVKGALGVVGGGAVAIGIASKAAIDIAAGVAVGGLFGGPLGALVGVGIGLASIIGGGLLGYGFFKKSLPYLKEPKIREALNRMMGNVLKHYKQEEYSDVLMCLSDPYADKKILVTIREVNSSDTYKILLEIQPTIIVQELLSHDFSPDGIAYFLVLLGEVLLLAPELKPKEKLPSHMRLELPSYSEYIHLATKVFEEVWINEQLIARAQHIDKQIKSKISWARTIWIESVATTTLAYKYSVPRNYVEESLITPIMTRLEELKNIAQINYAISQMIIGGTGNLNKSINTIKEVRRNLMKEKDEKKMFPMAQIRLQALSDLLIAFGHPEDVLSDKNESFFCDSNFLELECSVFIRTIDTILIDNQTATRCEPIVLFDDDEVDEFILLDRVLGGILKLDKVKFVENVRKAYVNNAEPVRSWMTEVITKENFRDFNSWERFFLNQKRALTFQYLRILSKTYNLIFKPCIIKAHRDYSHIFFPTGEIVNFCNSSTGATVYLLADENNARRDTRLIKGIFVTCDIPLNYFYNQLEFVRDPKLKANLFNRIAAHYQRQAAVIDRTHHLAALAKWDSARKIYIKSLESDKDNLTALLGNAKCLLMLHKYKAAANILLEDRQKGTSEFYNSAERWFLLGVLKRKLRQYDEAIYAVKEARRLGYSGVAAQNELDVVSRLKRETTTERLQFYKRMSTSYVEHNREQYNILSIDGGGVRGLVPAIWISELERVTGLKSSSMFHMMAGTSTGAIIAAGLSLPDKNNARIPRYTAMDIVQLYTTHSNKIFSRRTSPLNIFGPSCQYTDTGRKTLFDQYFESTRLSQTLTDLVITTVRSGSHTTDLFRRSESLSDSSKNHKLTDVLMCTTAAPTYFSPYKYENSVYFDGGVQANNPAMIAYSEACRGQVNRDNIFVLSLGTGDYVPDPLRPNASRNLLFWLANKNTVLKVVFDGPQNNIDDQLSNMLGSEKYHRWQVWLEEPIALDDIRKETIDNLTELARTHFEEMDAYDSDRRLGKLIERLRGSER